MATVKDNLVNLVPQHIIEDYPRFFDFLEAYYEWLQQDGNPYERVKNHMDYMTFEKSLADYTDQMKNTYLVDMPEGALVDKELFIKWSRKFNLARGSAASYRFLFRLIYGEDVTIYRPKDNILKTSDGKWVSGEQIILVTNSNQQAEFLNKRVFQERQLHEELFEYAYGTVERITTKFSGKFAITEMTLTDIDGTFEEGFPIKTVAGNEEWPIPTVTEITVDTAGSGFVQGQSLDLDGYTEFDVTRNADVEDEFDTRLTSTYVAGDLTVTADAVPVTGFTYDGRTIFHTDIDVGAEIIVTFPSHNGYIIVDETTDAGEVISIEILDPVVGPGVDGTVTWSGFGSGLVATSVSGLVKPIKGHYADAKGQLSAQMYLQDSSYYQDYSYSVVTGLSLATYEDIVKKILHPGGFALFGDVDIVILIQLILSYEQDSRVFVIPEGVNILHKYGLGMNFGSFDRIKAGVSARLFDVEDVYGIEPEYFIGEDGYNKGSKFLFQRSTDYEYSNLKGWMERWNFGDYHIVVDQDYSESVDGGDSYFESGYVSTRT